MKVVLGLACFFLVACDAGAENVASGIAIQTQEVTFVQDSCMGSCGGQTPSQTCWCDDACSDAGDCCVDYQASCQIPMAPMPSTVGNFCGGIAALPCGANEYCDYGPACGFGDQSGVCQAIPTICTESFEVVCGCDGASYENPCTAAFYGVSVKSYGFCPIQ